MHSDPMCMFDVARVGSPCFGKSMKKVNETFISSRVSGCNLTKTSLGQTRTSAGVFAPGTSGGGGISTGFSSRHCSELLPL